jgi:hypothetical protein
MRPGIALEIRNSFLLGLLKNVERKKPVVAYVMILSAVCVLCVAPAFAQQLATEPQVIASQAGVPPLIRFTGTAQDVNGNPLAGLVGITFSIYAEESGGSPLWVETQNVQADKNGHYAALLGATKPGGLPLELFSSGESRWLGVQTEGQAEQTRALLVAVPYALKASDAETIGGLPPSAFVLANQAQPASNMTKTGTAPSASSAPNADTSKNPTPLVNADVTGKGVVDFIPMWDTTGDIVDSMIFQKTSEIGVGTTAPAATLDVNGKSDIRDTLTLFPKGTDSALAVNGTAFKISQTGEVTFIAGQTFPDAGAITGIMTAAGSGLSGGGTTGTLSLKVPAAGITDAMLEDSKITLNATTAGGLVVPGAMTLGDTYTIGLKTCAANQFLEYSGTVWTCTTVGTDMGGITDVVAGTDLTGGGTSGKVTLNVDTTKVPQLAVANRFTANQTVIGSVAAVSIAPGAALFGQSNSNDVGVYGASAGASVTGMGRSQVGVWGDTGGASGNGFYGVVGTADSNSAGLFLNNGAFTTLLVDNLGGGDAIQASTAGNVGIYSQAVGSSIEGSNLGSTAIWGDTGAAADSGFTAVLGTADDNVAGFFVNNGLDVPALAAENDSTNRLSIVFQTFANFGECIIDVSGDLNCSGSVSGIVSADGGARKVALYSMQSAENWFEDAGSGQLANGFIRVELDPTFAQTVNTAAGYHVFLTPKGDSEGLYVTNETPQGFEVHEQRGGHSNIAFDYRIMAKRSGYENLRLADVTEQFKKQEAQRKLVRRPAQPAAGPRPGQAKLTPPVGSTTRPISVQSH